jgi:cysteinyl-tRNA synthetase
MTIRVYNTLGGKKEPFVPLVSNKVGMYVCGPTVYDDCHIGHARSVVTFDVIARYLRLCGYDVKFVRNFTDVDDKIIKRASETGVDSFEISEKYIKAFYRDMDALNVKRADVEPKVTDHMDSIIQYVKRLVASEKAYPVDGDVYYSVESFVEYGKLSGRRVEEMEAGARVEIDERKRNPFDFALWKSAKPGEPSWESPWGMGRPGWHIECSAMSCDLLGESFDIHGGGKDLIFPHHENEIAQSEGASCKPYAKYWIHNGFVNIDKQKMSKSLGNFLMIKDVIKLYHPEAIRVFLLSSHYRSPIDFSDMALKEASARLDKFYALLARIEAEIGAEKKGDLDSRPYWGKFQEAMDDDFNSALGFAVLFEGMRHLNAFMDSKTGGFAPDIEKQIRSGRADLLEIGRNVFGIFMDPPADYFNRKKQLVLSDLSIDPAKIERMIKERSVARESKDWVTADRIRKAFQEMNIVIEDRTDGTVWKVKN